LVTTRRIDVRALQEELRNTLRHGARVARLYIHARNLVDILVPPNGDDPEESISDRAITAEEIIRTGVQRVGGHHADALAVILGLKPGTQDVTLEERRRNAARLLDIQPNTFRVNREGILLWDLAFEIYKLLIHDEDRKSA
jgi:hypothetical protein